MPDRPIHRSVNPVTYRPTGTPFPGVVSFGTSVAAIGNWNRTGMNRCTASALLLFISSLGSVPGVSATPSSEQASPKQPSRQPSKQSKNETTLTGCVDEQNGQYLLINDRTRDPIADLVADGFPTEGFARHLGHTVTVRGTVNSEGVRPVFRVRGIQPVSDTCGPQHSQGN
jgi:hypothetical protein